MTSISEIGLEGKNIIVRILPTFELKVTDRQGFPGVVMPSITPATTGGPIGTQGSMN